MATAHDPIDDCVHCGFCLPACPTYQSWSLEMDSPRGRIYLMKGLRDGELTWNETVAGHFDACLGCMACVTACPSGVRYDVLIEHTRAERERAVPRGVADRLFRAMLFALLPYPRRLRAVALLLWLYAASGLKALVARSGLLAKLPPRLAQLEALAPPLTWDALTRALPPRTAAAGERRLKVGLVAGCVQRVFFPGVNDATVRVLSAEGCDVLVPDAQGCCGALSLHAGRPSEATELAKATIRAFEDADVDVVVVNAAGCGSSLKEYGRLFEGDRDWRARAENFAAKVRDVTELVAGLAPRAARHRVGARVAYHDACHLAHAQGVRSAPRAMLRAIPGVTLAEIPSGDQCCGSAGIYNLVEPASAEAIGARKAAAVAQTKADVLVSANPGCTLQIQRMLAARGATMPALHPIELLDRSLRGDKL